MFTRFPSGGGVLLSLLLAAALSGSLEAQPVPEGPETAFVTAYLAQAVAPAIAFDSGGDLAAMFVGGPLDFNSCMRRWAPCEGPVTGLLLDRFAPEVRSSLGLSAGGVPHVDTEPRIARGGNGFVAAWTGREYCNIRVGGCIPADGSGSAVYARQFGSAGPGEVFQVNFSSAGNQRSPAVSIDPWGGFAVAWHSDGADRPGILMRIFGPHGEPGPEIQVSSRGDRPQLAHGPDGKLLAVWEQAAVGPAGVSHVHAGLYYPGRLPFAHHHRISDTASAIGPVLAALPGGGFAVAWFDSSAPPGAAAVRVRRLDPLGVPEGPSIAVTFPPEDFAHGYDLAADETGGLLLAWEGVQLSGGGARQGIFATYLDAGGDVLWRSQPLSQERPMEQSGVRAASDGRRAFAVSWFQQTPNPVLPAVDYFVRRLVLPGGICEDGPFHLCLQGRFSVESRWRGGTPATGGDGMAVPYSASTGFFAMRDPAGWDMGVKILDTRARNEHFALYEGNLCEPESWVRTIDTVTGLVRIDHSATGQLCGQRDSLAFDASVVPKAAVRTCRPGPGTLCLLGGRFLVRARWKPTAAGPPQPARAVAGSDRSGLFWFYTAGNPAIVVQMVDGRQVNGKFWLLHSGLTPRDYTLTVTDLAAGVSKTFSYSAGDTCGKMDKEAF